MTILTARYPSKCAATGAPIRRGDTIQYDHATRTARLLTADEERSYRGHYVSDVFNIGGKEFYRNKRGKCEDAPCCGCCTI